MGVIFLSCMLLFGGGGEGVREGRRGVKRVIDSFQDASVYFLNI